MLSQLGGAGVGVNQSEVMVNQLGGVGSGVGVGLGSGSGVGLGSGVVVSPAGRGFSGVRSPMMMGPLASPLPVRSSAS